jgi:hypothetical protein
LVSLEDSKFEIAKPGMSPADGLIQAELVEKVLKAFELLSDSRSANSVTHRQRHTSSDA